MNPICLNCARRNNFDCPKWNTRDEETCDHFEPLRPARSML